MNSILSLTNQESVAITYLRTLAVLLIVSCHILQGYGSRWAWILNVGVQIFFFISGFLYGTKSIQKSGEWYYKRIVRIYIPYFLYLVFLFALYSIFQSDEITIKRIVCYSLNLQGVIGGGMNGIQHLWFLTVIMICYLFTPPLERLYNKNLWLSVPVLALLLLTGIAKGVFWGVFIYTLGYTLSRNKYYKKVVVKIVVLAMMIAFLFFFNWKRILDYSSFYNSGFHIIMGVGISLFILYLSNILGWGKYGVIKSLDNYSYEIYITHHVLILGPFSILFLFEYKWISIVFILIIISMKSYILKQLSNMIIHKIKR